MSSIADQLASATVADAPKTKSTGGAVHIVELDLTQSTILSSYVEEKRKAVDAEQHKKNADAYMSQLKDIVQEDIEIKCHGTEPPKSAMIKGETIDGETITQNITIGKTAYGKKVNYVYVFEHDKSEEIRAIVGNDWFESHLDDVSRFTVHLAMIKDASIREQFMSALVALVNEWELPRKDENGKDIEAKGRVPRGTMKYERMHKVKESFHKDRFALDLDRHNQLRKVLNGGCTLTAGKFTG